MLERSVVNDLLQFIETPSRPVFGLARSLASLARVPERALQRLMALCPAEKALRETASDVTLDPRSQEVLVGMALLLHDSGGQHADVLLPTLLGALRVVASADGQVASKDGTQLKPQVFVDLLVTLLLGADLGDADAQRVMQSVVGATQQLAQTATSATASVSTSALLIGLLDAISRESALLSTSDAQVLVGAVCKLLKRGTKPPSTSASGGASPRPLPPGSSSSPALTSTCVDAAGLRLLQCIVDGSTDVNIKADELVQIAVNALSDGSSTAPAIAAAVTLCTACAKRSPSLCSNVGQTLLAALHQLMAVPAPNLDLLRCALHALHDLCVIAVDAPVASDVVQQEEIAHVLPTIVAELKGQIIGNEQGVGSDAGAGAKDLCLDALCAVLRIESDAARCPDHLRPAARDTLAELSDAVRRATRDAVSSSRSAVHAIEESGGTAMPGASGQNILNPLSQLVPLLGRITCGLMHPDAVKLACPLLVDTFTFLQEQPPDGGPTDLKKTLATLLPIVVEQVTATAVSALELDAGGAAEDPVNADEYLHTVAELLTSAYLAEPYPWTQDAAHKALTQAIRDALVQLRAAVGTHAARRAWLEEHVLTLFAKMGQLAHSSGATGTASSPSRRLLKKAFGELLPVLAVMSPAPADTGEGGNDDTTGDLTWQRDIARPNKARMLLYRDVWYNMVLYQLVDLDSWAPEQEQWHLAVRRIAAGSPVLLLPRRGYQVGKAIALELEHNTAVLRAGQSMTEDDIAALREPVERYLPPKLASALRAQSFHNFLFLASLYYLETIRAASGNSEPVFTYMAVADIAEGEMTSSIEGVISLVFSFWLETMVQRAATPSRNELLERHLVQLLPYAMHPSMANIAGQFVQPMLERFPHLHWSSKACFKLFEMLDKSYAKSGGSEGGGAMAAESEVGAEAAQQDQDGGAQALCRRWIARATHLAPTATQVLLQSFERTTAIKLNSGAQRPHSNSALAFALGVWSSSGGTRGVSVGVGSVGRAAMLGAAAAATREGAGGLEQIDTAMEQPGTGRHSITLRGDMLASDSPRELDHAPAGALTAQSNVLQAHQAMTLNPNQQFARFTETLVLATHYKGEVSGMRHLHKMQKGEDTVVDVTALDEEVKSHLLEQFSSLQVKYKANAGAPVPNRRECASLEADIIATTYRSVALLVTAEQGGSTAPSTKTLRLLHYIATAPAAVLTPRALSAATFAWQWLAIQLPQLATPLLINICAAWVSTIQEGRGLFSGTPGGAQEELGRAGSVKLMQTELFASPRGGWLGHGSGQHGSADAQCEARQSRLQALRSEIAAHAVWAKFLEDWVNIAQQSVAQMEAVTGLLLSSLANPRALSHRRDSFATRFRLLRLALFVTYARQPKEQEISGLSHVEISCSLLNERVVSAGLCWFEAAQLSEPSADERETIERFLERLGTMSITPSSIESHDGPGLGDISEEQEHSMLPKLHSFSQLDSLNSLSSLTPMPEAKPELRRAVTEDPKTGFGVAVKTRRPSLTDTASLREFARLRNAVAQEPAVLSPAHTDRRPRKRMTTPSTGGSTAPEPNSANGSRRNGKHSRSSSGSERVGAFTRAASGDAMSPTTPVDHAALPRHDSVTLFRAISLSEHEGARAAVEGSRSSAGIVPSVANPENWLQERVALLEVLLTYEIDDWSAYHMVAKGLSRTRAGMKVESRSLDARTRKGTLVEVERTQHVRVAWEHSPRLALRTLLVMRGCGIAGPEHEQQLTQLICASPRSALHLPDALPFLLPAALRDAPHLSRFLLYWAPCSLSSAIGLLSRVPVPAQSIRSPPAVRYAMRAMQCFASDKLVFFLPQLVQALRGDGREGGMVRTLLSRFLIETAQLSTLVAHQLLWQLCTESREEPPEHGKALVGCYGFQGQCPGDDPLPAVAEGLQQQIIATLSPEARLFQQKETRYFDAVTNISGQLRDITDKTMHNAYIKRALTEKISSDGMKEGMLYLPTSPDSQVVGVDVDSGAPMQSAAKCPFLLIFKVQPFGGPDEALRQQQEKLRSLSHLTSGSTETFDDDDLSEEEDEDSTDEEEEDDEEEAVATAEDGSDSAAKPSTPTPRGRVAKAQRRLKKTAKRVKSGAKRVKSRVKIRMRRASNMAGSKLELMKLRGQRREFAKEMARRATPAAHAHAQACIFKVYDDCRQDVLCIQIIQLFDEAFKSAGLPLYLKPYKVIANRTGNDMAIGGIIEVVPQCKSRDQVGKAGSRDLYRFFQSEFGAPGSDGFRVAQYNFAVSLAAYAVVCYIMWIKDRHNGNLLVDNEGHVIHIDFGFLLGISPGGNLGFETAAFKFSKEMVQILGGRTDAKPFKFFMELCVKGFLAARKVREQVVALVASMADSGLPCYHFANTLEKLNGRFKPEMNDVRAAKHMRMLVLDARQKATTTIYDGIQKLQNNIHSDAWR